MAVELNSLPLMICLEDFGGDYSAYIDAVYQVFFRDFIQHRATFGSHKLHLRYHPTFQERPYAFYHMTHKGDIEDQRLPDLRRCERIPWARPTVEQTEKLGLRFWEQTERRNGRRVCIWLDVDNGDDYFVILYVHRHYVRLLTAFYGGAPNYARKRKKEYEQWKESVGRDFTPDELIADIVSRMPEEEKEG
jgi:hypothetical protein